MSHLSPAEFADHAEGTLAPAREAHLHECRGCREQADAVRDAFATTRDVTDMEPSPLFWEHFSARVRERIADTPVAPPPWWRGHAAMLASAITVMLLVLVIGLDAPRPRVAGIPMSSGASISALDARPDAAWDMLASLAEEDTSVTSGAPSDAAHALGLSVRPATVDAAVLELSAAEREELGRLLKDELKRSGA